MKTKSEIFLEIEEYVRTYNPATTKGKFIPIIYSIPTMTPTKEQVEEMAKVVSLVSEISDKLIGSVTIGLDLTATPPKLWTGVILTDKSLKHKTTLISNIPFKKVLEKAG